MKCFIRGGKQVQLNIEMSLENCAINLDWRRSMLSYIKNLLEKEWPEYFEDSYGQGRTGMKKMNFWGALPGPRFEKDRIILSEKRFRLYISSSDNKLLLHLHNAILKYGSQPYPIGFGNTMVVKGARIVHTKPIESEEIIVKMISPLVVRRHNRDEKDRYFLPNEEGFEENVVYSMQTRFGTEDVPTIEPIKTKKVIVKAYGTTIPASLGIFKITGNKRYLNELYLDGAGAKSSGGFGKFEIIG